MAKPMNKEDRTIFLKDYTPFPFSLLSLNLDFQLMTGETVVTAIAQYEKKEETVNLHLAGEELQLESLLVNGKEWQWNREDGGIVVCDVPEKFSLKIVTRIYPEKNKALEGLYKSSGTYCTQCEAEGFRKITYFPDRPDVLTRYTTRIEADKSICPVLLSNGNLLKEGGCENGRHYVVWEDPFPKPSYLFALVAGELYPLEDYFITRSGRKVVLKIFVEKQNRGRCRHAMDSLKKAMRWDEEVFGLEYDLDIYMIVAVDDFNMGAMENKGLNVFNSKYVLTSPELATDQDYLGVESVIAHEYFHNWTGNRVTCRDWFQLSLKEGLTVFRDQEFSSDMNSRPVQRIEDVRILKNFQFKEDASPMAHPVQPDNYQEINNFYTTTVYNKGAEVIRMIYTLIGKERFLKGMDLYIARHDGQAVTCEEFIAAMEHASGVDLRQFFLWYQQAGTPELQVTTKWIKEKREYRIVIEQSCPDTPNQSTKKPFHIPVKIGLMSEDGPLVLANGDTEQVLELREKKEEFILPQIAASSKPILSFLRDFSAPVRIRNFQTREELAFLAVHDTNLYNRWECSTRLASEVILEVSKQLREKQKVKIDPVFLSSVKNSLVGEIKDSSLLALALQLPFEMTLAQKMVPIDPEALHYARENVMTTIAEENREIFFRLYERNTFEKKHSIQPEAIGRRSLKNVVLRYLMSLHPLSKEIVALTFEQYKQAENMTDTIEALRCLNNVEMHVREQAFDDFYRRFQSTPLVLDKWFMLQATSSLQGTLEKVKELQENPVFSMTNPNKVRALIGAFCTGNHYRFHAEDGSGYQFLVDSVLELNGINPQIAARLISPLISWRAYEPKRSLLMKRALEKIAGAKELSRDVDEIVSKSLIG